MSTPSPNLQTGPTTHYGRLEPENQTASQTSTVTPPLRPSASRSVTPLPPSTCVGSAQTYPKTTTDAHADSPTIPSTPYSMTASDTPTPGKLLAGGHAGTPTLPLFTSRTHQQPSSSSSSFKCHAQRLYPQTERPSPLTQDKFSLAPLTMLDAARS
jgi:hypothetical protein